MSRGRHDRDLDAALQRWMSDVAPRSVPTLVLEEAFSRTMVARQARVYPWHRVCRVDLVSGAFRCWRWRGLPSSSSGAVGFGVLGGGSGPPPIPGPSPTPSLRPTPSPSVGPSVRPGYATPRPGLGTPQPLVPASPLPDPGTGRPLPTELLGRVYNGGSVDGSGHLVASGSCSPCGRGDDPSLVSPCSRGAAPASADPVDLATERRFRKHDTGRPASALVPARNVDRVGRRRGSRSVRPQWQGSGLGSIWVGVPKARRRPIDPITRGPGDEPSRSMCLPVAVRFHGDRCLGRELWRPEARGTDRSRDEHRRRRRPSGRADVHAGHGRWGGVGLGRGALRPLPGTSHGSRESRMPSTSRYRRPLRGRGRPSWPRAGLRVSQRESPGIDRHDRARRIEV